VSVVNSWDLMIDRSIEFGMIHSVDRIWVDVRFE